jgi:O-antigen/teichoic acid export membrane protein
MLKDSRQYAIYSLGNLVNLVVGYLLLFLLANNLSKAEYAQYGLISTVMSLFIILLNFGARDACFKYASKSDTENLSGVLSSYAIYMAAILLCALLTSSWLLVWGLALISYIFLNTINLLGAISRGFKNYTVDAAALPLHRVLLIILVFIFIKTGLSLQLVYVSMGVSGFVVTLVFISSQKIRRLFAGFKNYSLPFANRSLQRFFLLEFSIIAYSKVDVLMLGWLDVPSNRFAEYFFSVQLYEAAILLLAPIGYFYFNRLNEATKHERSSYYIISMLLIVLAGILIWWFVGPIILSQFFPLYKESHLLTTALFCNLSMVAVTLFSCHWMIANNKELSYAINCLIALCVTLISSPLFISWLGVWGGVLTKSVAELAIILMLIRQRVIYRTERKVAKRD